MLGGAIFQGSTCWVSPKGMIVERQALVNIYVAKYLGKITRIFNNEVTHIVAFSWTNVVDLYNVVVDWQCTAHVVHFDWVYTSIRAKSMLDEDDYDLDPESHSR